MVIIYTVQNMSIIPIESMATLGCMFCKSNRWAKTLADNKI